MQVGELKVVDVCAVDEKSSMLCRTCRLAAAVTLAPVMLRDSCKTGIVRIHLTELRLDIWIMHASSSYVRYVS